VEAIAVVTGWGNSATNAATLVITH
jgi:hypothetical protein